MDVCLGLGVCVFMYGDLFSFTAMNAHLILDVFDYLLIRFLGSVSDSIGTKIVSCGMQYTNERKPKVRASELKAVESTT